MSIFRTTEEYVIPIEKGDEILLGKFRNKKAIVTGFDVDDKGQPIVKTNKGPTGAKFRVPALLPEVYVSPTVLANAKKIAKGKTGKEAYDFLIKRFTPVDVAKKAAFGEQTDYKGFIIKHPRMKFGFWSGVFKEDEYIGAIKGGVPTVEEAIEIGKGIVDGHLERISEGAFDDFILHGKPMKQPKVKMTLTYDQVKNLDDEKFMLWAMTHPESAFEHFTHDQKRAIDLRLAHLQGKALQKNKFKKPKKFVEIALNQLSRYTSPLTLKFKAQRKVYLGDEKKIAKLKSIRITNSHSPKNRSIFLFYKTPSTFSKRRYDVQVKLTNLPKVDWKTITSAQFKSLLDSADLKLFCSCSAFHWQGHKYRLKKSAIRTTNIADPIWGPRHKRKNGLCKHLRSLIPILKPMASQITSFIRKSS